MTVTNIKTKRTCLYILLKAFLSDQKMQHCRQYCSVHALTAPSKWHQKLQVAMDVNVKQIC